MGQIGQKRGWIESKGVKKYDQSPKIRVKNVRIDVDIT